MVLMIVAVLVVLGLCLGSFVNALVWRLHEQAAGTGKAKPTDRRLSITRGRSMCPHCRHELATADLIPVISWLTLRRRCRYCHKPISVQYPLVEAGLMLAFVASYLWWPAAFSGAQEAVFVLWLVLLTGLSALLIYDLRWKLLPNRLIYPLSVVAAAAALITIGAANRPAMALLNTVLAVAVGGGLFYLIFQVSGGKWIGGGDVRLGWLLGLIVGTPARAFLVIFLAALGGTVISLPLLASRRLRRNSAIPFGPFLILAAVIVELFGAAILSWYRRVFIGY